MSKKTPAKTRSRRPSVPTPPIVRRLAYSFLYAMDQGVISAAYQQAKTVLATDPGKDEGHTASIWIQRMAERELQRTNPALLDDGSDYRTFGGDVQTAFQEPAFCLGFALAFLLFSENGGAR